MVNNASHLKGPKNPVEMVELGRLARLFLVKLNAESRRPHPNPSRREN